LHDVYLCRNMRALPPYKKIAAALLLLVMLLTTFVQVTHSHNSKPDVAAAIKKTTEINTPCAAAGSDINCFFCDYHLVKDADFSLLVNTIKAAVYKSSYTAVFNNSIITNFTTPAGNRGPPLAF
jgi:hypothetical protein